MNHSINFKFLFVAAAMIAVPSANAVELSRTDYRSAKTHIDDDYKVEKIACTALMSNARDVCIEEAKGREKNARAELEYRYTGSTHDMDKIAVVKAEAAYAVAKEKCDDFAGNDKDVCVKAARAVEVGARADAKTAVQIRASTNCDLAHHMCNPVNTLPNDHGYGAAEIARGEMSCNDGYALHEMMQPVSAAPTNAPESFDVRTINLNSAANP